MHDGPWPDSDSSGAVPISMLLRPLIDWCATLQYRTVVLALRSSPRQSLIYQDRNMMRMFTLVIGAMSSTRTAKLCERYNTTGSSRHGRLPSATPQRCSMMDVRAPVELPKDPFHRLASTSANWRWRHQVGICHKESGQAAAIELRVLNRWCQSRTLQEMERIHYHKSRSRLSILLSRWTSLPIGPAGTPRQPGIRHPPSDWRLQGHAAFSLDEMDHSLEAGNPSWF
jgi:hypothetical protein